MVGHQYNGTGMMNSNTPPRQDEPSDEEVDMDNIDEVYELESEDDVDALDDHLIEQSEENQDEDEESDDGLIKEATIIYTNHKDSVFSVACSPNSDLVATGGEDDKAYVWDAITGETKLECSGHEDSVTYTSFSHDGTYLATGDLKGRIQAWKISTLSKVWEFDTTEDLNFVLWHPSSNILFAGTCTGDVWMWLIPQGQTKSLSHSGVSAECAIIMKDGKRMCVGYFDGSMKVIDLKSCQTLQTFQSHSEKITSIAAHQNNVLIMSGGLDGVAVITNSLAGKEIGKFNCAFDDTPNSDDADDQEYNHAVEVVSFCPSMHNIAITATLSGLITVWDIISRTSRHHIIQGCGTSALCWYLHDPYFFSAGIDGKLRVFDARSGEQKGKCVGHTDSILGCDINKENTKIITCADDSTARIFSIEEFIT